MSNEYQTILTAIDSWLRRDSVCFISLNRNEMNALVDYIRASNSDDITISQYAGAIGATIKVAEGRSHVKDYKPNTEIDITDHESW